MDGIHYITVNGYAYLLRGICGHNLDPKSGANCGFCYVYIFPGVGTSVLSLRWVSKDDEFFMKNKELCMKNKELCMKNKEICFEK